MATSKASGLNDPAELFSISSSERCGLAVNIPTSWSTPFMMSSHQKKSESASTAHATENTTPDLACSDMSTLLSGPAAQTGEQQKSRSSPSYVHPFACERSWSSSNLTGFTQDLHHHFSLDGIGRRASMSHLASLGDNAVWDPQQAAMSSTIAPPPRRRQSSSFQRQKSQDTLSILSARFDHPSSSSLSSEDTGGFLLPHQSSPETSLQTPTASLGHLHVVSSSASLSRLDNRVLPNPIQPPVPSFSSTITGLHHQRTGSLNCEWQQDDGVAHGDCGPMLSPVYRMDRDRSLGSGFDLWGADPRTVCGTIDRSISVASVEDVRSRPLADSAGEGEGEGEEEGGRDEGERGGGGRGEEEGDALVATMRKACSTHVSHDPIAAPSYGSLDAGFQGPFGKLSVLDNAAPLRPESQRSSICSTASLSRTSGLGGTTSKESLLHQDSLWTSQGSMQSSLHPHVAPAHFATSHLYGAPAVTAAATASSGGSFSICALCRVQVASVSLGACGHRVCSVCHRHEKHRSLRLLNSHAVICPFCSYGVGSGQERSNVDLDWTSKDMLHYQQEPTGLPFKGGPSSPQLTQQTMPAMAYPTGMLQVDLDGYPANRQYHPTFPLYTPPYSSLLLRTPSVHEGMIQYDNPAASVSQPGTTYPRAHHRTQQQQQQQQQQPPLGNSQYIQGIQKSQFSHIPHSIVPNFNHPYWAFSRDPSHATMGRLGMIVPPSGSWRESSQPIPDPTNMTLGSHPPAQHGHDAVGGRTTGVQTQQRGYGGQKYGHPTQPQPLIEQTPGPIHEAVRSVDLQESQFPIVPNILPTVPPVGMRPQSWKWAVVRITNIPWDISLQDMAAFFAGFPMPPEHLLPQHVHILMDRSTGKTFNSAFVELAMTPQQAGLVAQSRNFKVLKGRLVTVELSSQDELLRSIFPKWTGQFIQGEPVLHLQQQDGSKTVGSTTGTGVGRGKGAASATAVSTATMSTSNANHTGPGSTGGSNSSGYETVRPVRSVGGMENVDDDPPKMESSRPLSTSVSNSTLASSYDSINKYAALQEAPTPSPTHPTSQSMLFASDPATPPFVTRDEINALLVVCRNYKLHFSRKCAERPFENILSIITKYPWHQPQLVLPLHRDHIFELLKLSIESLRVHLSKDFHTIHPTLLERMVRCAILTPAFTERQKAMVLHVAGCPCPENLLPWMSPPPSTLQQQQQQQQQHQGQQQQQQVLQKHQSLSPNAPAETSATAALVEPTGMMTKPVTTSITTAKLQPSSQDVAPVRETPSDLGPAQASILATNQEGLRSFTRGSKQEKSLGKDASKEASDVEAIIECLSVMGLSKKASLSSGTMKSPQEQAGTLTSTPPLSQSSSSSSSPTSIQHTKQNTNNNDNFSTTTSSHLKSTLTSWATIAAPNAAKRGVVEPATSHSSDTPSSLASMPSKTSWDTTLTGTQATMVSPSSSSSFRTTAAAHSSPPPLSNVVGEAAEATLLVTKACPNISHTALGTDDGEERGGGARNHLFRGGGRGGSQKEGSLRDTASSASSTFSLGSVTGAPPSSLTSSPPSSTSSSSESLLWAIKNITQSTPRLTRSASQAK